MRTFLWTIGIIGALLLGGLLASRLRKKPQPIVGFNPRRRFKRRIMRTANWSGRQFRMWRKRMRREGKLDYWAIPTVIYAK